MNPSPSRSYDPRTFKALSFHDAVPRFREGADSPRAYLERCIEMIQRARADRQSLRRLE